MSSAAAQVPVREFIFSLPNNNQIQCTGGQQQIIHQCENINLDAWKQRFIGDIVKDGPNWTQIGPILNAIYTPEFQIPATAAEVELRLNQFTDIDLNIVTPYPNIPKSSISGSNLKVLEHRVNTIFHESGYGPDRVCKNLSVSKIYTPASLLDSLGTKGDIFWPSISDNINLIFDNAFMKRMGFYGTEWAKINNIIHIVYSPTPTDPTKDTIEQPITSDMTVKGLQDGAYPISPYMQGNDSKNGRIIQNFSVGNLNECIKLIETKELGDFMQVLLYLAYIMIEHPIINNISMITTDSVVFAACIKLRLPCLYTGCRLDILPGHATFYNYTPGLIDYLEKLKSMINHHLTTVLMNNETTKAYLQEIYDNPNKCKFIIDDPNSRIKQKPGQPIKKGKIIQGLRYRPYDRKATDEKGILEQNRTKIRELIVYIDRQNKDAILMHEATILSLTRRIEFVDLNINRTLYKITHNAAAAGVAAVQGNPNAAAALPAAAAAANDLINQIYRRFEIRMQKYKIKHVITSINDDNFVLAPHTNLFKRIAGDMNIKPETTELSVIIEQLQISLKESAALRGVEFKNRKSAIAAAAAASVAQFSLPTYAASAAAPAAVAPLFQFSLPTYAASAAAPTASAAAPAAPADSYNSAASYGSASSYAALPNPMNTNSGGAINFENDYKELLQSINKEIENEDSELVTNLFLCYAFQVLINMQNGAMEYGLSKSDKLFELAIKSTNPKDIKSLNELVVYNEFINSIHYYSIKDKKNSDASLYFGSYLLALDHDVYHYQFAIIYDNLISTIDSDTVLNKYQIGEICGTNDNNILKYGKILKKYINFIDDNSDMMKNIEKSVAEMIKNSIDMTKTPTTGNTILTTKTPTTGNTKTSITGNTKTSITGKTTAISNFKNHLPKSIGVRPLYKIPVGGSRKKHNRRKKIDTRKRQQKHKHKSRKHSHKHAAIRTSKARPASRRFR